MTILNLLRLIPLLLLMVLFGATLAAIYSYIRYRAMMKVAHAAGSPIPGHVLKVGLSYLLFVLAAVAEVVSRINNPSVSWRLPVYSILAVAGLWGVSDLVKWEVSRFRNARVQDRAQKLLSRKATCPESADRTFKEAERLGKEELADVEDRRDRIQYQLDAFSRRRRDT